MSTSQKIKNFMGSSWGQKLLVLLIICVAMAFIEPKFFRLTNWLSIVRAISIYGIMACGMFFVVLVGGLDLSVGSVGALAASITLINNVDSGYAPGSFVRGVIIAMICCVVIGMIHGELVTRIKMNPFVVTLASKYTVLGIAMVITNSAYRYLNDKTQFYYKLGSEKLMNVPYTTWIFILVAIICTFILVKTTYGRKLYVVGGNPEAAKHIGIRSGLYIVIAYIICTCLAGVGGILLSAMNAMGGISTSSGYEGTVLMAMIVGGIDLSGGDGTILDALYGAFLVGIIENAIILIGVPADYQKFIEGVIILIAMALNVYSALKSQGPSKKKKLTSA